MTFNLSAVGGWVQAHSTLWGPVLLALGIAGGGGRLVRRRPDALMAVGALAATVGWAVIVPESWRRLVWPQGEAEWLTLPALVMAGLAGAGLRGRRWTVAAACFGAWWLARSPAGRAEFWRVEFGAVAAAWMLTRCGAALPQRGVVAGLAVFGGVWAGNGTAAWMVVALVPVAVCLGLLASEGAAVIQPGLLMLGLVGAELGAGRAVRGGVGIVDLACWGALVAPLAVPVVERRLRWLGRAAGVGSAVSVAGVVVGLAWVVGRRLH